MKLYIKLLLTGVVSGFLLGVILKGIQSITGKKVYTLLLNVDYIPIVNERDMCETVEFLLHVLVSVALVFILYYVLSKLSLQFQVNYYVIINTVIGLILFFTTSFSERTPDVTDLAAMVYWIGGHIIYGAVVGVLIKFLPQGNL
ncbi:hypothetical protein ACLIBG_14240 [Virgibacillus sp. W0181]|uniref:hypothetical protein n=1 Tax=Virgibacillus sp. W0181 TaxID=3391581 RepID=UPI003F465147